MGLRCILGAIAAGMPTGGVVHPADHHKIREKAIKNERNRSKNKNTKTVAIPNSNRNHSRILRVMVHRRSVHRVCRLYGLARPME